MKTRQEYRPPPSEAVILERSRSFANESMWTVVLQHRRLRTAEPEDDDFIFRRWVDWQFLIVALSRLRYAAQLAKRVPAVSDEISRAMGAFDGALPGLRTMRNVAEHIDEYVVDEGRANVERGELQVGLFDESAYEWLGYRIEADGAKAAAQQLFDAIRQASKRRVNGSPRGLKLPRFGGGIMTGIA